MDSSGRTGVLPRGFPHSEIPGSKPACGSPRLIAACHVLHRLLLPRHPPCALSSLTIKFTRHTPASPSAVSFRLQLKTLRTRRVNSMGLIPAHRTPLISTLRSLACPRESLRILKLETLKSRAPYTSRFSGTHKNLHAL